MSSNWSKDELSRLENLYFAGWTLAQMAREMGRSPTAINKTLSRSGIRPKKQVFTREEPAPYHFQREWVRFKTVISYLEAMGTHIDNINKNEKDKYDNKFIVNGEEATAAKMLYMANKERVDKNLSTYFVRGITI